MEISILLTTYNRNNDCIRCLDTLKPQITDNIELILLDEWHIESDLLKQYCKENNFKYIHTGIQKGGKIKWRVPGFALNIGAKYSKGNILILGNAELYHVSTDTLKLMNNITSITQPIILDQPINVPLSKYKTFKPLCERYPWFMGIPRKIFFNIGGYDEDFIGVAWEDTDLSSRLLKLCGEIKQVKAEAIHIWNPRGPRPRKDAPDLNRARFEYNKKLYYNKLDSDIVRNKDRDWGVL